VAGVFSGALSTVSGGLNSLAAVTLEDFLKVFVYPDGHGLTDRKATNITKFVSVGYGIFSYLLIFLVKNIPGLVQAWLGIFGIFGGPVLGLFTLGMFFPR
jgi:Na+/proline symporter